MFNFLWDLMLTSLCFNHCLEMAKRKNSKTLETPSKKLKLSQSSYELRLKTSSKILETPSKKEQLSQSSYDLRSKTSSKIPQTPH